MITQALYRIDISEKTFPSQKWDKLAIAKLRPSPSLAGLQTGGLDKAIFVWY